MLSIKRKPVSSFSLRVFYACALCVAILPVHGERKAVAYGLLGGLSAASFWGEDVNEVDFELMPTAGISLAFHLPAFLGVEVDALYLVKSGALSSSVGDQTKVDRFTLHYLEFPLLLKISAPTESEAQPFFLVGVSLARLVMKESTSEFIPRAGIISGEFTDPLIPEDNLRDYQVNVSLGGGLEWGLGSLQLRLSLARNSIDETDQVDIRNVVLAVMAGFIF